MEAKLEALLFIYGEPMTYKKIAKTLGIKEDKVCEVAAALAKSLTAEGRGLFIVETPDKLQLTTKPEFGKLLEDILKEEVSATLTPAALETLSIVTYAGPLSRAEIEYIRGVNSTFTLRNLLIRGLIDRVTDPKRSNAYLYKPSFDLLKFVGVANVIDLPNYQKFNDLIKKLREPKSS